MYHFKDILLDDYQKWSHHNFIYEKEKDVYIPYTFKRFIEDVNDVAYGLLHQGYQDKNIVLFGANSYTWMVFDVAIAGFVGTSIGVSKESNAKDIQNIVSFLDVSLVIYESEKQKIMDEISSSFPNVTFMSMNEIEKLIALGKSLQKPFLDFDYRNPNACIKVVFTSGTSSLPKAVMLSEKNIFAGYPSLKKRAPMDRTDRCYLFLPLHHTYGGIYNFYYSLISGMQLYLCSHIDHIPKELLEVKPTVFCSVPLIYKKMYQAVHQNNALLPSVFGGCIKYLFCGGASMDSSIKQAYLDAGISFLCAYALSETASSFAIEYANQENFNSEGVVFEDIDVKVIQPDEDGVGELAVKGDCVFLGYMNNLNATKEAFNEEGYFLTGDLGYIDQRGHLYIKGRKKAVLLTDKGENIYPNELEEMLKQHCDLITSAKFYVEHQQLNAILFVKEETYDYHTFIHEMNQKLKRHEQINRIDVILDRLDVRLKQ